MKKYFILLIIIVGLLPNVTLAYTAVLNVTSNNNSINAIEGTLEVPKGINISQIHDGNSIILFWVDKPTINKETNTIRFSGFTPGGFQGSHKLFSFSGDFTERDLSRFAFVDIKALKNDGLGTEAAVDLSVSQFDVPADNTSPEKFSLVVSRSVDIFNNSCFISFTTQDKGVGIDHYEYATSRFFNPDKTSWKTVESPLILTNSELSKRIFIKAIDKSGNERISTLYGPKYFEYAFIGFIIGVLILCVLFYISKMFL